MRTERRTIVVFCEGSVSEPIYIQAWKQLPEVREIASVVVEIDPAQGVPMKLVRRAIERKERDREVDEYWCVFDVEWPRNHPNLPEAIQLAEQNGIRLAISNPCFELWLILHGSDQSAFLTTADAVRRSGVAKRFDPSEFLPHRHVAADRAAALAKRHFADGKSLPDNNPSSGFGDLLATVEQSRG